MKSSLNVFKGRHSVRDFLNPGKHPYLPLVEIPPELNPFLADRVRIHAKLMTFTPLGNIKAMAGFNMIREEYARGELEGVKRAVENSSGNTVTAVALVARQFGVPITRSFVPHEISWHKLLMLLFFDVEPIVNAEPPEPDPNDARSGVYKARKLGRRKGWINPGQYENEDNPKAHQKWTARQIWQQTQGNIGVFSAGLGTTGTLIGNARYLKRKKRRMQVVGVMREDGHYVPGVRTEGLLQLIRFDWRAHVDAIERIETVDSYRRSLELSRQGLIVGPSSGFALAGLLQYLQRRKDEGSLDELRESNGEVHCVFICCDSPFPYLDEYFKYLDRTDFPPIHNESLLLNKPG